MTHPSSPQAPMTTERLADIRSESLERVVALAPNEAARLFAHIDALTARVATLETELAAARKGWRMLKIVGRQMDLDHGSHHAHVVDWPADWPLLVPAEYEIRALQTKDTTP